MKERLDRPGGGGYGCAHSVAPPGESPIIADFDKPKIRPIEVIPLEAKGARTTFALRDPAGHGVGMVTAPAVVVWLFQFFDGRHTWEEIGGEFRKEFSQFLPNEQLKQIIESLDQALLLEGGRFEEMKREYLKASVRQAAYAGPSYPGEAEPLRQLLDSFYVHEKGPRRMPFASENGKGKGAPVAAIVAPHIDLRSGGPCFAHAYEALSRAPRPDLFVILGTGHAGLDRCFAATRKDFETPLGMLKTGADFVARLADRFGPELFEGELLHKREHVIEFQTLFLRHLYGDADIRIAPILCSYAFQQLDEAAFPQYAKIIRRFAAALRETIAETPGRVCLIASVDLAHIGPRYGDTEAVDPARLEDCGRADSQMLECVADGDLEAFDAFIRDEEDSRHICGFPCLHTMLETLGEAKGNLLKYDATTVDNGASYVSFASMVFG